RMHAGPSTAHTRFRMCYASEWLALFAAPHPCERQPTRRGPRNCNPQLRSWRVRHRCNNFFNQVDKLSLEFAQESGNGVFSGIAWQPTWSEIILGASITHELGHLLLGTTHTQDDGIMMPSFARTDLIRLFSRADRFDPQQAT